MRHFQAVIFDMDGTLFDSERKMLECWNETARAHGFTGMENPYPATLGVNTERTREILMEYFGETFPYQTINRERMALYRERYGGGRAPVKSGAANILSFLKSRGRKIALATSSLRPKTVMQLEGAGFLPYFDAIVTGDMAAESKPDPEIFLIAARELGVDPSAAYVIEDSYQGIRAAHRGGFHPIMIPDMMPANEEMRGLAEAVLDSLNEAVLYLEGEERKLQVVHFHESSRQEHWLQKILQSDWRAGAFLHDLLTKGTFFDAMGEHSRLLLLTDGDELLSYCTFAEKDDIQPTDLTPWVGFVYTFPKYRGHRYMGLLFEEAERLARAEHTKEIYLSTNHEGLYEKYGWTFKTMLNDMDGKPSKVYVKRIDSSD